MTKTTRPPIGTPEYESWRKEKAQKRAEQLLNSDSEFDQSGVLSGSREALKESTKPNIKPAK